MSSVYLYDMLLSSIIINYNRLLYLLLFFTTSLFWGFLLDVVIELLSIIIIVYCAFTRVLRSRQFTGSVSCARLPSGCLPKHSSD